MEIAQSAAAQAMEDALKSVDQGNENGFLEAIEKLIHVGKGAAIRGLYYAEVRPFFKEEPINRGIIKSTLKLFVGDGKPVSIDEFRSILQEVYHVPTGGAKDLDTLLMVISDDENLFGDTPIAALIYALEKAKDDAPSDEVPNTGNNRPTED